MCFKDYPRGSQEFCRECLKQNYSPLIEKNEGRWGDQWHSMCTKAVKSEDRALDNDRLLWQGLQSPLRGWLSSRSRQAFGMVVNFLCEGYNRNWCHQVTYLIFTCLFGRWWKTGRGTTRLPLLSSPHFIFPPFHLAEQGARRLKEPQGLTFYSNPSLTCGFVHKVSWM